jgi:acetoin utilization deacetylase AcuC-like enzyme
LPWGTAWDGYARALDYALGKIAACRPDVLVVSLGVDTFECDPISRFKLASDDYLRMGACIGKLGLPTLFVMEGGYAVEEIGINVCNVLAGFEES